MDIETDLNRPPSQTVKEKISIAKSLKEEGNALFKQEKFSKAKVKYCTALAYTRGLPGRESNGSGEEMAKFAASSINSRDGKMSAEDNQEVDELDAIIKTNIATCLLKLNRPTDALQYSREALTHNPAYWKASLRTAEAMEMTRNYDGALLLIEKLLKDETIYSDASATRLIRTIREKIAMGMKSDRDRQRKAFGNVFERMNKATESDKGTVRAAKGENQSSDEIAQQAPTPNEAEGKET